MPVNSGLRGPGHPDTGGGSCPGVVGAWPLLSQLSWGFFPLSLLGGSPGPQGW